MALSPSPKSWSAALPYFGPTPRRRPSNWLSNSSRWPVRANANYGKFTKRARRIALIKPRRLPDANIVNRGPDRTSGPRFNFATGIAARGRRLFHWRNVSRKLSLSPVERDAVSAQPETATTHRAIDAVWRIESAKIIAALTRIV